MPCPNCDNKEERLIVKNGFVPRKIRKNTTGEVTGPKVQRYVCTKCGYTARGSAFGLPEMTKEVQKID